MTLIDTNVILRYLLNDIPEQTDKAAEIITGGAFTLNEIIAEVVYVLVKLYNVPRKEIKDIISPLFDEIYIDEKDIIISALEKFSKSKFDFVDCVLLARKSILGENIFTFDKKLANQLKK